MTLLLKHNVDVSHSCWSIQEGIYIYIYETIALALLLMLSGVTRGIDHGKLMFVKLESPLTSRKGP
jgi:hypothetical protein